MCNFLVFNQWCWTLFTRTTSSFTRGKLVDFCFLPFVCILCTDGDVSFCFPFFAPCFLLVIVFLFGAPSLFCNTFPVRQNSDAGTLACRNYHQRPGFKILKPRTISSRAKFKFLMHIIFKTRM